MKAWHISYKCEQPSGLQIVNGDLPDNYNNLDLNVSVGSLAKETQLELEKDFDEEECESAQDHYLTSDNAILEGGEEELGNHTEERQLQKWMISKTENGKLNYIHINQAIKLLLPGEYIARCRQKRQWASFQERNH